MVEGLGKTYPTDIGLRLFWLPTINAAIDVSKRDSSQALVELEPTAPDELGFQGPLQTTGNLYPAYVRGQAHLLAHDSVAAVAEF